MSTCPAQLEPCIVLLHPVSFPPVPLKGYGYKMSNLGILLHNIIMLSIGYYRTMSTNYPFNRPVPITGGKTYKKPTEFKFAPVPCSECGGRMLQKTYDYAVMHNLGISCYACAMARKARKR